MKLILSVECCWVLFFFLCHNVIGAQGELQKHFSPQKMWRTTLRKHSCFRLFSLWLQICLLVMVGFATSLRLKKKKLASKTGATFCPKIGGGSPQMVHEKHNHNNEWSHRQWSPHIWMLLCLVDFSLATTWLWSSILCVWFLVWGFDDASSGGSRLAEGAVIVWVGWPWAFSSHRTRHARTKTAWVLHLLQSLLKDLVYENIRNISKPTTIPNTQKKSSSQFYLSI